MIIDIRLNKLVSMMIHNQLFWPNQLFLECFIQGKKMIGLDYVRSKNTIEADLFNRVQKVTPD